MTQRTLETQQARPLDPLPEADGRMGEVCRTRYYCFSLSTWREHPRGGQRFLLPPIGREGELECTCSYSHPHDRLRGPVLQQRDSLRIRRGWYQGSNSNECIPPLPPAKLRQVSCLERQDDPAGSKQDRGRSGVRASVPAESEGTTIDI